MPLDKNVTIVSAQESDLPELMRLVRLAASEGDLLLFPLDEDGAQDMLKKAIKPGRKEGFIGIVRGDGSEIKAMMYLLIVRQWCAGRFHLEELFNYVAPEHRQSNYADALIRYAMHAAEQLKTTLVVGVLTNTRMEAKVRLYRRRLGMPSGAFFIYNSEWAKDKAPDLQLWKQHSRGGKRKKSNDIAPLDAVIATAVIDAQLPLINGG